MALARFELGVARRGVGGDGEHEVVDQRLLAIKVLVRLVADDGILLIGDERERAGADRRLVELLGRSLLEQEVSVFLRPDRHEVHRQIGEDGDIRRRELHDDGVVVRLLQRSEQLRHVHVVEVVVLAARDFVIRIVGLPLPVERKQDIIGVEVARRLEILQRMELDALAQVKGDRLAAVGDFPAFGEARDDVGRAAVEFGQAIVDGPRGIEAGPGGVDRRREILRTAFGAIDQGLCR